MSILYNGLNALPYTINPVPLVNFPRNPTQNDYQNFFVGTQWINSKTQQIWQLVSLSGPLTSPPVTNYAVWVLITGSSGNVQGLNADNSVVALPLGGIINTFGNSSTITTSAAGNTVTFSTTGSIATTYDGNTGTATPSSGVLHIVGDGTTATTTASGNTVTISSTAVSAQSWVLVTTTTESMAVNTGYVADNSALVTLTLPATAAFGARLTVTGIGSGGWSIAQNSGQTIYFGTSTTTTGATGSLSSTQIRDTIDLVCVIANTSWNVINSVGNITVV